MPIPVSDIMLRASIILNDEDFVRWTKQELIDWLNDAAGEVVVRRPQSRLVVEALGLEEGVLQKLPEGAVQLVDVVRNLPGRSISRTSRRLLDDQVPDWYDMRPSDRVKHFTLEEETPTHFYVYPPVKAGVTVEARYSARPPRISSEDDTLDMDPIYIGPLVSYVIYRALAKDSEYADGAIALAHFQAFNEALGTNNTITAAVTASAGAQ